MADPIEVKTNTWKEPHARSPAISDKEFGIKFACVPAKRGDKDTIALLGSYRLPGQYDAVYGSRIPGALQVVAIHQQTGRAYHGTADRPHMPPLDSQMRPEPGPNPWGPGAELAYTAGHFNMDLRGQLALANDAADYVVFVWLDDVVSDVQSVPVPATTAPALVPQPPATLTGLQFRKITASPAAAGPVTIEAQPDGAIPMEIGPHLVGTIAADQLPAKGSPPAGRAKLTLLSMSYLSREFRAASVDFPAAAVDAGIANFDLPLKTLATPGDAPDKCFILACVGKSVSKVVVVKK